MSLKNANILVVDDSKSVLDAVQLFLKRKCKKVLTATSPNLIHNILETEDVDLLLLDMNFTTGVNNGNEGMFWIRKILETYPDISIIPLTAYGDVDLAVKAVKAGAFDFLQKPWENDKLFTTLLSAYKYRKSKLKANKLEDQKKVLQEESSSKLDPIIGESPAFMEMLKLVEKAAPTDASVLILGENGVGKELVARRIHQLSERKKQIFLGVDMGSVSESLFESEIFGHKKGAFTDAKEDRTGKFEAANGGSLFLDEIGNLSVGSQAKLLKCLQERQVVRLGANKPIDIDVRLISATNKNLDQLIREGDFREDLMYRINTIQIVVPRLRERKEDISLLANFYVSRFAEQYNKGKMEISKAALHKLEAYRWPGNIRELKHTMEKAVILSDSACLQITDFVLGSQQAPEFDLEEVVSLEQGERILIERAIRQHGGNISEAAKQLGIGRQTLYRKMDRYEL
jgi:DNA-binding NtrC family response regulator